MFTECSLPIWRDQLTCFTFPLCYNISEILFSLYFSAMSDGQQYWLRAIYYCMYLCSSCCCMQNYIWCQQQYRYKRSGKRGGKVGGGDGVSHFMIYNFSVFSVKIQSRYQSNTGIILSDNRCSFKMNILCWQGQKMVIFNFRPHQVQ